MPSDGELGADRRRALALMVRFSGELSTILPPPVAALANSNTMMRMFVNIDAHPGLTPSALADRLGADRSVISRNLAKLDTLGFVVRRVDSGDRRQVRVRLSSMGRRQLAAYSDSVARVLAPTSPLLDELLELLAGEEPPAVADPSPAIVLDQLSEVGNQAIERFLVIESAYGITNSRERFVLALAADGEFADTAGMANALKNPQGALDDAARALGDLGLANLTTRPDAAGTIHLSATPAGARLVDELAVAVSDLAPEFARVLAMARAVADMARAGSSESAR